MSQAEFNVHSNDLSYHCPACGKFNLHHNEHFGTDLIYRNCNYCGQRVTIDEFCVVLCDWPSYQERMEFYAED